MEKSNSFVVFYSRTGTTKKVAHAISESLNCDIGEITEKKGRSGFFGFMKSGYQATFNKKPPIIEPENDPSSYELVIIGTPTWARKMTSPVRTYMHDNSQKFKKVAFFCTKGGVKSEKLFKGMKNLCEKEPIAKLALLEKEVKEEEFMDKVKIFVDEIKS